MPIPGIRENRFFMAWKILHINCDRKSPAPALISQHLRIILESMAIMNRMGENYLTYLLDVHFEHNMLVMLLDSDKSLFDIFQLK